MRIGLLALLVCCGGPSGDTSPNAGSPVGPSTGPGTGTPSGTALPTPSWEMLRIDDVWPGTPGGDQHHPTHARHPDGSTLVAWDEVSGLNHAVAVRAFDPDGNAMADAQLLADVSGIYSRPDGGPVDGGWLLVWNTRLDVFVDKVAPDGVEIGVEVPANTVRGVDPDKGQPDLAVLEDGSAVIVYHFADPYADPVSTYYIRRYNPDLTPMTPESAIATSQVVGSPPDVAARVGGGFAVAWSTRDAVAGTLNLSLYDNAGDEERTVRVDQSGPNQTPSRPNLAIAEDGTIALAWRVQSNDGVGQGAYGRIFEPDGTPRTDAYVFPQSAQRGAVSAGPGVFLYSWEPPVADPVRAQLVDARTGLALEEPWEPFPGSGAQQRSQSSFWQHPDGSWRVVFTADRGDLDNRTLMRAMWKLDLE